jgi:hypothetical protein
MLLAGKEEEFVRKDHFLDRRYGVNRTCREN